MERREKDAIPPLLRKAVHENRLNKLNDFAFFPPVFLRFIAFFLSLRGRSASSVPPVWLQCGSSPKEWRCTGAVTLTLWPCIVNEMLIDCFSTAL